MKGTANKLRKETVKFNINVPIKPNSNLFKRIRSDKDELKLEGTVGKYKMPFENENKYYTRITKCKM